MCSGIWEFELVSLSASYFGPAVLAAQSIAFQCASMGIMFFLGLSVAISNIIGNLLGAGKAYRAKRAAYTAVILGVGISITNAIMLMIFKDKLPYFFSKDPEVIRLVELIIPVLAMFQVITLF